MSWEDKKKIEDLKNRQKDPPAEIDNLKQQQQQNAQQQMNFLRAIPTRLQNRKSFRNYLISLLPKT